MNKPRTMMLAALAISLSTFGWAQGGFNGPGRYVITNVKSGKVLDLDRNDQTTLLQFSPRGTENQAWEIRPAREGFVFIRNMMNGNALTVTDDRNSAPVQGVPFNGSAPQMWRLEPGRDGNILIVSRLGKALDVPGGATRDGVRVNVYDRNGESNQRFVMQQTGGRWGQRRWDWDGDRPEAAIRCSSDDGRRRYCETDTGRGVRLVKQISGSVCEEGRTWGFDRRGIWVDRGCRADFAILR
jgi:Protein of unknown function (DUF3011)/Ricin-type beta-trefoil lectin domain-like